MTIWQQLTPFSQQLLLLVIVVGCKQLLQSLMPHSPWRGFRFYCTQLANKVNKRENGVNQQLISGAIATLITFAPLWVILWLFESLVAVPHLYQALLLYLALGDGSPFSTSKQVAKSVTNHDNYSAKQLLNQHMLRDTDPLSSLGINKATIEMLTLKHMQNYIVTAFWFLSFGPLMAISYRLLIEMHYSWNTKLYNMQHFGYFAARLTLWLQFIPVRIYMLCAMLLVIGQQFLLIWRLTMVHFFSLSNNLALSFIAYSHNIRMAGVAMYKGSKLRRPSFNDNGRQPEATDIIHVQKFLLRVDLLLVLFLLTVAVLLQLVSI